jgi:hypothetical protein
MNVLIAYRVAIKKTNLPVRITERTTGLYAAFCCVVGKLFFCFIHLIFSYEKDTVRTQYGHILDLVDLFKSLQ